MNQENKRFVKARPNDKQIVKENKDMGNVNT